MTGRDFFGFCTSLKPLELKAIGALSHVRHIEADETVYRSGDSAETLFIINRGVVEMLQDEGARRSAGTYLSRGDIFGDVEVLTGLPRKHCVRTREPVSVQCFERENLQQLVQRVPSFFRYLSEQLASRLFQAREVTLSQSHCLDLSGSLANFDLVTVYQTIVHSMQTGELSIVDERGELIAAFRFDSGRPCGGQFHHLAGEEAFSQLFLAEDLSGSFSFASGEGNGTTAVVSDRFQRDPSEILISALQGRDEMEALRAELPDGAAQLLRQKLEIAVEEVEPEDRFIAEKIWRMASGGRLQLQQVYARLDVCELKVYRALRELIRTGHLEPISSIAQQVA